MGKSRGVFQSVFTVARHHAWLLTIGLALAGGGLLAADTPAPPAPEVPPVPPAAADPSRDLDDAALLAAARAAYAQHDYARAIGLFRELCRRRPAVGAHWYELGRAQYHAEQFAPALDSFGRAREAGFDNDPLAQWAGYAAFKLGRWQATAEELGRIAEAGLQPEARLKRAIAWFNLGDSRAPAEFERLAVADSPVGFAARYYRALCWENAARPGRAYDLYAALRQQPAPYGPAAFARLQALLPPPWTVRIALASGYDSRPARANDDSNVAGAEPDGFTQVSFNFSLRPFYALAPVTPPIYWLSLSGYHHFFHRNHELDDTAFSLTQSLESSPERFFNFRLDQAISRHWLGGAPYFDEATLAGAAQWRWREPVSTHVLGLSLDGGWTHAIGDDFLPYQGLSGGLFTNYAWIWTPNPDWTLTVPAYLGSRLRQSRDSAEHYRQYSAQTGLDLVCLQRLLISTSLAYDDRLYEADPSAGLPRRREWPTTLAVAVELPLWPHSSVQLNGQWIEQQANQSAYRYSNRQFWLALYVWS